jgi:hypothetical protein
MNELIKYLNNTLGIEIAIIPLEKQLLQQLPLYVIVTYKVQETTIYGHRICLLIVKGEENIQTPDSLFKQMLFVSQKIGIPVVYVFDKIISYNIKRLIQKGINFIIPNKQLFIPTLMMDLRKMPVTIPQKTELFAPIIDIQNDMNIFCQMVSQSLPDTAFFKSIGLIVKSEDVFDLLCNAFQVSQK